MNSSNLFSVLVRAVRPLALLGGVLSYALGGGIANYLGYNLNWPVYWIGQGAVTFLQLSSYTLREYFDRTGQPAFSSRPSASQDGPPRVIFLQVAVTTLTAGAVMTVLLLSSGAFNLGAFVILSAAFVLAIAYAVPPLRLANNGYGELAMSILQANLFPALAFLLQVGEFHRFLALLTFPLTSLYLAAALAGSLQSYMEDLRKQRQTMLARLGWQGGMNAHNIFIAVAYLILVGSVFSGLPWRLAFPVFLSMPVALFQVWQINNIAGGGKPRWRMLSLTILATLAFALYFMNIALWTG
jgi:1,4-dihydroxy-2-naphthoate octaprenyltransferase